ncbi:MAG: hypothetical protein WAN65_16585, partial [Candidatus Sulfotelmatobacter sp.]
VIDRHLRANAQRHLEATVYSQPLLRQNLESGSPGYAVVRFSMGLGRPTVMSVVHTGENAPANVEQLLRGRPEAALPPYLNERRQLRVYLRSDLLILKPNEVRCWTCAAGLNDADAILADDWLATPHDSSISA